MSNISIEFRIENCGVNMTRKSVQIWHVSLYKYDT
jgi:hypothetical protein